MFKFNKIKNLMLCLSLFSFISGNAVNEQEKVVKMLTALEGLANNIEAVTKEFEQISQIQLNKVISAATINEMKKKEGTPLLTFSELAFKVKPALGNHFEDPAIFGEILELASSIILKKSEKETVEKTVDNIKTVVNKNFEITTQEEKQEDKINTPHLSAIYQAEIIQKILNNSKENPQDFKNFLINVINGLFPEDSSISKKSLIDVIEEIDVLF